MSDVVIDMNVDVPSPLCDLLSFVHNFYKY